MQRVAAAVHVRAPSLYKHVRDRDALVRLIAAAVVRDLGVTLAGTPRTGDARADLAEIALAFRAWAHRHPGGFGLLFARVPEAWRIAPEVGSAALEAMFSAVAAIASPDHVLDAAR